MGNFNIVKACTKLLATCWFPVCTHTHLLSPNKHILLTLFQSSLSLKGQDLVTETPSTSPSEKQWTNLKSPLVKSRPNSLAEGNSAASQETSSLSEHKGKKLWGEKALPSPHPPPLCIHSPHRYGFQVCGSCAEELH